MFTTVSGYANLRSVPGPKKKKPMSDLGERLRVAIARSPNVANRQDFCAKIHMDQSQLAKYENAPGTKDARTPSIDQVKEWARVLGVTVGALVGESPIESTVEGERPAIFDDFYAAGIGASATPGERLVLEDASWRNGIAREGRELSIDGLTGTLLAIRSMRKRGEPPLSDEEKAAAAIAAQTGRKVWDLATEPARSGSESFKKTATPRPSKAATMKTTRARASR